MQAGVRVNFIVFVAVNAFRGQLAYLFVLRHDESRPSTFTCCWGITRLV